VILILIRDRDSVPPCLGASVRNLAIGARASARFDVEQHRAQGMSRRSSSSAAGSPQRNDSSDLRLIYRPVGSN